jgi:hypothetical protein
MKKKIILNLIIIFLIPVSLYARNWKPANTNEFNRYCVNNLTADPDIAARFTMKQILDVCDCVCVYYDSKYPDFKKFSILFNNPTEESMREAYNAMYDCTSFILGNPTQTWYVE